MSETVERAERGSYDDVPDEHVATVLNVPIRLTPDTYAPTSYPDHKPTGRHRKPDPVDSPPTSVPVATRRAARTHHEVRNTHWAATLKVGGVSAAIVFCGAAILLLFLTRLP